MAKALTRQRGRRGGTSDRHERELKRLLLSICDDTGFRLYLATYDQPKRRDELMTRVTKEAEAEKVRVTRLDLSEGAPEANLVGLLRAHLRESELPSGWRQAVMIVEIEQRLDYALGREGYAFLHQANLLRDALPEAAPVPVVLWLSRMASAALPAEAPDLWHWRAANFDFTGDQAPRVELLRELTSLPSEDEGGLSGEQRRARIAMLEELFAELEREGPPQSKRQVAERATLLCELGLEFRYLGHPTEVLPRVEKALALYRDIGLREGEALALRMLGGAWQQLGETRRAIEHYQQHLAIADEIGDRRIKGGVLSSLGHAYTALAEPRRAIEHYQQALAIFHEIGDRQGEGVALNDLGDAYAASGEPRRAFEHYQQALAIFREIGDRRGESAALNKLGRTHIALGEPRRAIELCDQVLKTAREIGHRQAEGGALANLGLAYATLGETRRALGYFESLVELMRESGERGSEGLALHALGLAYAALGETRRAIEQYEQYLAIAREIGARQGEGSALHDSAIAYDNLGDRRTAIKRMEEALRIFEEIGDPDAERARAQLAEWRGAAGP